MSGGSEPLAVAVPTKNRPGKLRDCLEALAEARRALPFRAYVCDSSTEDEVRSRVAEVCEGFPFAQLDHHDGRNCAAARNACARVAREGLIVNVDDDIRVEPDSIAALYGKYRSESGPRVVAGTVRWGDWWSKPIKKRLIGWGRDVVEGEPPDFLVGALFLYPRILAETYPWNERIRVADDIFMGAVWRSKGVKLLFEPRARAVHHPEHVTYDVKDQNSHIYVNLFDTLMANRNLPRAAAYELLGFASGLKGFVRDTSSARAFLGAWWAGHRQLFADRHYLAELLERDLPAGQPEPETSIAT